MSELRCNAKCNWVLDQYQGYGAREIKGGYGANKRMVLLREANLAEVSEPELVDYWLKRRNAINEFRLWHGGQGSIPQVALSGSFNGGGSLNVPAGTGRTTEMSRYYWDLRAQKKFPVLRHVWHTGSLPNHKPTGTYR